MEEEKKTQDDVVFRVPSLPPPQPIKPKTNEAQLTINYKAPDWSRQPPESTDDNVLDEEGFCKHYFLEVIKSGTVIEKIKLNKEFISFGRLDACDVLCEHPTLSRFHAVLQYSNGEVSKDYPEGFYVYDLSSTHGTFINKTRLEPNKYTRLDVDSLIKFGMSTRIYVLHGPKNKNNADDLKINLTHEQMRLIKEKHDRIALKLRIRKEVEEEEILKEENEKTSASWGIRDDDEENNNENSDENAINPFAAIEQEDETYYASDPRKALKNFFDREGEELIYDLEELGMGKFKCSIQLPIENKFGSYMCAEVQHEGKKKDCMTMCALEACRILNAEGVLQQSRQDIIKRNKQKELESADYYDSDDDTYLDRTGDVERKRLMRMAQAGKLTNDKDQATTKNKTHTFESIKDDIKSIVKEKFEIENKLEKCKAVMKAVEEDDIDSYIESLKVGSQLDTVTRAKMKKRLVEINSELKKLDKLLNISKPASFDAEKWKTEVNNQIKHITKQDVSENVKEIVVHKKVISNELIEKSNAEEERQVAKEEPRVEDEEKPKLVRTKRIEQENISTKSDNSKSTAKKQKINQEELILDEYVDSKDYAVWVPPTDQLGDGRTKLNEKYGY